MADECEPRVERNRAKGRAVRMVAGVMLFAALYVASVGPVAMCVHKSGVATTPGWPDTFLYRALCVFYAPLDWLMDSDTPPGWWLTRYIVWWIYYLT